MFQVKILCILRQYSEKLAFVYNTMDNKERNEQYLVCCESIHKLGYGSCVNYVDEHLDYYSSYEAVHG